MVTTPDQMLSILEDHAALLRKTQINLKKCPKARFTKGYIQTRMKTLEEYWTNYKEAHQDLVKCTNREERAGMSYFANEEFFIQEDLYLCMLSDLKDMLYQSETKHFDESNKNSSIESTKDRTVSTKFPRIQMPTFSGNYEDWPEFKDLFESLVHTSTDISDVQKLHYLKTSVRGEAATLIKNLTTTNANYSIAWQKLNNRFGNKRSIVNSILKRLFSQRKCTTQSSAQLKALLDTTSDIMTSLKSLNVSTDSWDPIIVFLTVQKLDPETHREWEKEAFKDTDTLSTWNELTKFLESTFHQLEAVHPPSTSKTSKERVFHVTTSNPSGKACKLCNNDHILCRCEQFIKMNPTERSEYVKTNNLCFNCLASGHAASKCRSRVSCHTCRRRHHTLLHRHNHADTSLPTPDPIPSTLSLQETVEDKQVHMVIASYYNAGQKVALLATAVVIVHGDQGHRTFLKALIDSGSQACFISEKATQALKLKRRPVNLTVSGMESMKVNVKHAVTLQVSSRYNSSFNLSIQAYVMSKQLSTNIPASTSIDRKWPHLDNLDLADPNYYESGPLDLLLGVNEYTAILQQGLVKGPPGTPSAQKTHLGWIIMGGIDMHTNKEVKSLTVMKHEVNIDDLLKTMWEVEQDTNRTYTEEERKCEEIYKTTHRRNKEEWFKIREDLTNVNEISLERWLGTISTEKHAIQIHGFSDASLQAYAAVAYIRIVNQDGVIHTSLIASRTRVAPLRTISCPKLELCGALLLSRLLHQIGQAMRIPTNQMYAWTDSSIVIAWLAGEPHRWKPFVANRVVEINQNLNNNQWYHVESLDNPADIASRGMLLADLKDNDLWWKGPTWLSEKELTIINPEVIETDLERKKNKIQVNMNVENEKSQSLTQKFEEFDSLKELIKVITYCRRFIHFRSLKTENDFTTEELEISLRRCIKMTQEEEFKTEIERLRNHKLVKRESKLKSLNPYLDKDDMLRVGGRLRHACLDNQTKHPIILGANNMLVPLIIADAHDQSLHGGIQVMLCLLWSKYWILNAKRLVKKCIGRCLICAKQRTVARTQLMGDLPKQRVTPSRPFINSGVDFAGPLQILMSRGRGSRTQKAYIAIFICMSTKAIHLELVGDLTSQAFIAAFKRFVSRRGKCTNIWSDQGRNFVGADKELREALMEAKLSFEGDISNSLALDGTQWHFIPAYSPHHGGLWESGVKSIKFHLKRVLTTTLTYEEMTTVLCQVEACLNSRPLCPIDSTDSDTIEPLTPGHFLMGEAPIAVPSTDYRDHKMHTLSRWQHTQKLVGDIWRRWQNEYLSRLQQRPKWLKKVEEFKIGDIVLIKVDGLPPGKWFLGRVVDKHPGHDGITRVYSIKSGENIVKRPITKLCYLPIETD